MIYRVKVYFIVYGVLFWSLSFVFRGIRRIGIDYLDGDFYF